MSEPTTSEIPVPAIPVPEIPVEVIRSRRRTKTVGAVMRAGVLQVTVPSWISEAEAARWVDTMRSRFARRQASATIDLAARARRLARRHRLPEPAEIRWVSNMAQRWGSCTPATGTIRLSDRMVAFPDWVVDYVIVHELAHLRHPDHSPAFHDLERRYPLTERAIGYLIARSAGTSGGDASDLLD